MKIDFLKTRMDPSPLKNDQKFETSVQNISKEMINPSDDSGFSAISNYSTKPETDYSTIYKNVEFIDGKIIEDEKRALEKKIKKKENKSLIEKRLAQETYEKEIQEKQYMRLMHLLTQSKALTSFIIKKFDNGLKDDEEKKHRKRKGFSQNNESTPAKRGRKPKNQNETKNKNKLCLSQIDIAEKLAFMSDEETEDKENTKVTEKITTLKYFKGNLRDYQKEGLNWMKVLYENGLNGILADEMGLGKTVQIIALFSYLMEKQINGPYMIMVPLSTLPNWVSEFKRFAPQIPVIVYYGNYEERMPVRKKISKKMKVSETFSTYPVVLLTYEIIMKDGHFLQQFNWRYIVIDEGQRIKNSESQLFRILKSFKSVNRLLLTGTPLQNNLSELWSLLNFLLPDIFNDLEVFESWFDAKKVQNEEGKQKFFKQEQEKHILATLREILSPFILRRLKEEVCPDIPPMKEVLIYTPLTAIQYNLYSALLNRNLHVLTKTNEESIIIDVNGVRPKRKCTQKVDIADYYKKTINSNTNIENKRIDDDISFWNKYTNVTDDNEKYLIKLRFGNYTMLYKHVVNHPYLIHLPVNDVGLPEVDENIIKASGKLLVLDAMLKKLDSDGHKVLLFSTMSMVLDIIEDYLLLRDYQYVRLDGTVKYENRKNCINRFQTDSSVFLFLLTTKAGSVGLNLAAADTVIIYDSDWNPQNDLQAMARCHRIGQNKPVVVYRLCTKGTIDEEIIKRANAKRFLEKAVISKEGNIVNTVEGLTKLKKLFDKNTFTVDDSKNQVYTEDELSKLLDRKSMIKEKQTSDVQLS